MVVIVRKFIHPLGIHLASSKRGFTKVTSYLPTEVLVSSFCTGRKVQWSYPAERSCVCPAEVQRYMAGEACSYSQVI